MRSLTAPTGLYKFLKTDFLLKEYQKVESNKLKGSLMKIWSENSCSLIRFLNTTQKFKSNRAKKQQGSWGAALRYYVHVQHLYLYKGEYTFMVSLNLFFWRLELISFPKNQTDNKFYATWYDDDYCINYGRHELWVIPRSSNSYLVRQSYRI